MNKTKIEWCDATWNPVTGCLHGCEYCYARRIAERFGGYDKSDGTITTQNPLPRAELHLPLTVTRRNGKTVNSPFPFGFQPTLHRYRLEEPLRKKPQTIFVCSMADLFGRWVPTKWIVEVLDACRAAPQHRYLFLTKHPARYLELAQVALLPREENFWYGSTVTRPDTPYFVAEGYNTFLSIEPLLEPFRKRSEGFQKLGEPSWFILGAMTGPGSREHQPNKSWVEEIVDAARGVEAAVFMKESLLPIMGEECMLREFPWERTL